MDELSRDPDAIAGFEIARAPTMNRSVACVVLLAAGFAAASTTGCSASGAGPSGLGGKGGGGGGSGGSGGSGGNGGSGGIPGRACNFSIFGSGRTIDSQTDATTIVVRQSNGALTSINGAPCTSTSVLPYVGMNCGETYACGDCTFSIVQDEVGFWNFDMSEAERQKAACAGYSSSYLYNYVPMTSDCAADAGAACSSCIAACNGQVDCCCTAGTHCTCRSACGP